MLRVGTDCSGIEAPIQALKKLRIPFRHVFSSEIDKFCIQSIKANYNPEIIFGDKEGVSPNGDITKRSISDLPDIDLYVAGFPCQPFSTAGKRKGFLDNRGNVFFSCLEVIRVKKPTYFILENVRGLLHHNKGETWKVIWRELCKLTNYHVEWKVLNTKDYGIPQNRERVFIIGIKSSVPVKFNWPEKIRMNKLENFIDWTDTQRKETKRIHMEIPPNSLYVELNFQHNKFSQAHIIAPCLNTNTGLWNVKLHRYANCKEYLMLQGFPLNMKQVVSNTQFKKQIGNSMSVNILTEILRNLLKNI